MECRNLHRPVLPANSMCYATASCPIFLSLWDVIDSPYHHYANILYRELFFIHHPLSYTEITHITLINSFRLPLVNDSTNWSPINYTPLELLFVYFTPFWILIFHRWNLTESSLCVVWVNFTSQTSILKVSLFILR